MNLQHLYSELLKHIDLAVSNFEYSYKELKEIAHKPGLERQKAQLCDALIQLAQELVTAEKLVRVHHPSLIPLLDIVIKTNKERHDKLVNFIHQKLDSSLEKE